MGLGPRGHREIAAFRDRNQLCQHLHDSERVAHSENLVCPRSTWSKPPARSPVTPFSDRIPFLPVLQKLQVIVDLPLHCTFGARTMQKAADPGKEPAHRSRSFMRKLLDQACPTARIRNSIRFYSERMATMGWTEAARRAGARLATTATSTATAAPTTYDRFSTLLSGMPDLSPLRRMRVAVSMTATTTPGSTSFTTSNKTMAHRWNLRDPGPSKPQGGENQAAYSTYVPITNFQSKIRPSLL
jgi:hypothetical protein